MSCHRCHAVVREYREGHFRVNRVRKLINLPQLRLIPGEPFINFHRVLAIRMEKHIHLTGLEEKKTPGASLNVLQCLLDDLCIGPVMVCVRVISNSAFGKLVKNRRLSADTATIVYVPFFHPVEPAKETRPYGALEQWAQ